MGWASGVEFYVHAPRRHLVKASKRITMKIMNNSSNSTAHSPRIGRLTNKLTDETRGNEGNGGHGHADVQGTCDVALPMASFCLLALNLAYS